MADRSILRLGPRAALLGSTLLGSTLLGSTLLGSTLLGCAAPAGAAEGSPLAGPYGETLTVDDKGITLRFPDDAAKLRIGGKLQLDFGAAGIRQTGFPEPFSDNVGVRRSWIESYLTLGKTIELAFQYNFADPMRPINDAAIAWKGIPGMILTVGNMKEPFSLDQLTSDNNTVFTERSLADAFAPARNFGFAIGRSGQDWTVVTSVFGGNANTGIRSEGVASTTRATFAPIHTDDAVLHLGIAGSFRSLPRDESPLALSSRSEAFLFARPFVNTGDIRDAASVGRLGLEAAYRTGRLLIQAEYIRTEVSRFDGARSVSFQGGYVEASYVLNGQGRAYAVTPNYGTTYAIFEAVKVGEEARVSRGGIGVFELAARVSAIDLDDGAIRGGIERDVSVGVNWYPDRNVRIMADYVRSRAAPSALQGGRAIDTDVFIGRFQVAW
ncbi:porin [Methylobacterium sp. WL103]|uniref:OprO/OprP family phosphate-selective porin n=1 Tax=Methylobacterium sp. WL103 TaxID=2603891 RepID=UPI0011C96126|nr:porin [Methylobacterium sp. WL103]TXM92318.1 porin [Methylobacterium sp. WL103]